MFDRKTVSSFAKAMEVAEQVTDESVDRITDRVWELMPDDAPADAKIAVAHTAVANLLAAMVKVLVNKTTGENVRQSDKACAAMLITQLRDTGGMLDDLAKLKKAIDYDGMLAKAEERLAKAKAESGIDD